MVKKKVDIKILFYCNNYCKFCVQGVKRKNSDINIKSYEEIRGALIRAFKNGKRTVCFTGGEPTLHPRFIDIIKTAKKIGYEIIQIQCNGRMFSYPDLCQKAIEAGANEFCLAIHGHNAKIHDFLTSANGSFDQSIKGIINLKNSGQSVFTNTVITKQNYKGLPKIVSLLTSLGVSQLQLAFPHIAGNAKTNKDWLIPRKSEVIKYVKKGLDIAIKKGVTIMTEAIPLCFMEGYLDYVAEKIMEKEIEIYDAGFVVPDYRDYRLNSGQGKIKAEKCRKCKYFKICEGPWVEYPEMFGWDEFKPVK